MIDTDKYEGHTEGPWRIVCWERHWYIEGDYEEGQEKCTASTVCDLGGTAQRKDPTARLIADAPLLLEEVKELRRQIKAAQGVLEYLYDDELEDAHWIRWFCNMEDEEE